MTNSTFPLTATDKIHSIVNSLKNGLLTSRHAQEIADALDLNPSQGNWFWESNPAESGFIASKTFTSIWGGTLAVSCKLSLEDQILGWEVEI